jgi:hypothetical protein
MVLSTCSPYFRSLFATVPPHLHPVVFLKDVEVRIVELLLRYMYSGQVSVLGDRLVPLVQAAKSLQIKGLLDVPVPANTRAPSPRPPPPSEASAHKAVVASNASHKKPQTVNNRVQTQSHPVPARKPKMIKPKSSQQQPQQQQQQQLPRGAVPIHRVPVVTGAGGSDSRFPREEPLPPLPVAAQSPPPEAARVVYPVISVDDDMR